MFSPWMNPRESFFKKLKWTYYIAAILCLLSFLAVVLILADYYSYDYGPYDFAPAAYIYFLPLTLLAILTAYSLHLGRKAKFHVLPTARERWELIFLMVLTFASILMLWVSYFWDYIYNDEYYYYDYYYGEFSYELFSFCGTLLFLLLLTVFILLWPLSGKYIKQIKGIPGEYVGFIPSPNEMGSAVRSAGTFVNVAILIRLPASAISLSIFITLFIVWYYESLWEGLISFLLLLYFLIFIVLSAYILYINRPQRRPHTLKKTGAVLVFLSLLDALLIWLSYVLILWLDFEDVFIVTFIIGSFLLPFSIIPASVALGVSREERKWKRIVLAGAWAPGMDAFSKGLTRGALLLALLEIHLILPLENFLTRVSYEYVDANSLLILAFTAGFLLFLIAVVSLSKRPLAHLAAALTFPALFIISTATEIVFISGIFLAALCSLAFSSFLLSRDTMREWRELYLRYVTTPEMRDLSGGRPTSEGAHPPGSVPHLSPPGNSHPPL